MCILYIKFPIISSNCSIISSKCIGYLKRHHVIACPSYVYIHTVLWRIASRCQECICIQIVAELFSSLKHKHAIFMYVKFTYSCNKVLQYIPRHQGILCYSWRNKFLSWCHRCNNGIILEISPVLLTYIIERGSKIYMMEILPHKTLRIIFFYIVICDLRRF